MIQNKSILFDNMSLAPNKKWAIILFCIFFLTPFNFVKAALTDSEIHTHISLENNKEICAAVDTPEHERMLNKGEDVIYTAKVYIFGEALLYSTELEDNLTIIKVENQDKTSRHLKKEIKKEKKKKKISTKSLKKEVKYENVYKNIISSNESKSFSKNTNEKLYFLQNLTSSLSKEILTEVKTHNHFKLDWIKEKFFYANPWIKILFHSGKYSVRPPTFLCFS